MNQMTFRFYGPLNDFLPAQWRHVAFEIGFAGRRSVKDAIESLGVPHPEIDLITINDEPAPFDTVLQYGDRTAVFPRFYSIDISGIAHVRPHAQETIRFALDGHLGKLSRRLRLLGLDAACPTDADDAALAMLAKRDGRVLLTRDRALLKRGAITRGYYVRETQPQRQLVEVVKRYGPFAAEPFSRCLRCNGELDDVPKAAVAAALPPRTGEHYDYFRICRGCGRIYWRGSHWVRLQRAVDALIELGAPIA